MINLQLDAIVLGCAFQETIKQALRPATQTGAAQEVIACLTM